MFTSGSRYAGAGTYVVTRPDGSSVTVTRIPLPGSAPIVGWHRRLDTERLDLLAAYYLKDPTASWQLGWTNDALILEALERHELIAVPGSR